MKVNLKLIAMMLVLSPLAATASSLVCSSERLYSSNVRVDFGNIPTVPVKSGSIVIVYDGQTLLNYTSYVGLNPQGIPPYQVSLTGEQQVLEQEGGPSYGSMVFRQTAVLNKMDSIEMTVTQEIAREEVLCRKTWSLVP